jgi:hypothetical protein
LTFESGLGEVVALITQVSFNELDLEKEHEATMLMRGVDISVEPHIDTLDTLERYRAVARIKDAN